MVAEHLKELEVFLSELVTEREEAFMADPTSDNLKKLERVIEMWRVVDESL